MDGVLVIDKPQGLTSHDVVAVARRVLREKRIGHTGTLDPMATGVLPLACGKATRLARFLTASDKEYDATIRFGLTTDTYDITGTVVSRSEQVPSADAVHAALEQLRGEYLQLPPAYSAKKVGGRRAYEMAREDEPVALTPVPVRVSRADVVELAGDTLRVTITCSAGFYVRSFAHQLGELAGSGACLAGLRRTRSGDFGLDAAVTLDALQEAPDPAARRLIPLEALLPSFPAVRLTDENRRRATHGQALPGLAPAGDVPWVRLLDADGRLVGLATPAPGSSLRPAIVLT